MMLQNNFDSKAQMKYLLHSSHLKGFHMPLECFYTRAQELSLCLCVCLTHVLSTQGLEWCFPTDSPYHSDFVNNFVHVNFLYD